ncbi:RTA1-like protein [Ceratobasidium sp. AG-Ba]|nr:RTA1-like protein [Ceratobasidium sp. AG-Ba]
MVRPSSLITVLSFLSYVAAQDDTEQNPAGGRHGGPLGYIPTVAPAIVFFVMYVLIAGHGTWMSFRIPGKYMTTLVISGYFYAVGLILRIPYRSNSDSLVLFIVMNLFTVLSPCGFIATVYILLGRLARHLEAEDLLLIKPQLITKVYVCSDIATLLIQAAGGSLAVGKTQQLADLSTKIFLAGLILQLISFLSYCVVFSLFLYRLRAWRKPLWNKPMDKGVRFHWKGLVGAIIISCVGIIVRCVYRTVEGSQGFDGYLLTHEVYFFVLDTLPLWFAVVIYTIIWPPAILTNLYDSKRHEMIAKESTASV